MRLRLVERDEKGAFIVLYALLLVAILTIVAIVLDLASLRTGLRTERLSADLSATAGASALDPLNGGSPNAACKEAWAYLDKNLGISGADGGVDPCASGALASATCTSGTIDNSTNFPSYPADSGHYTIKVVTPVEDTDPLMTSAYDQTVDSNRDGTDCERIGVQVTTSTSYTFGRVVGAQSGTTTRAAVARFTTFPGTQYPALTTLDQHGCAGTNGSDWDGGINSGSAAIAVEPTPPAVLPDGTALDPEPGIVYLDSDASGSSYATPTPCTPSGPPGPVLNSQGSGTIEVDGPTTGQNAGQPGIIGEYCISQGCSTGNNSVAWGGTAGACPIGAQNICPRPSALNNRITRAPVDRVYHCGNLSSDIAGESCASGQPDPIASLVSTFHSAGDATPVGTTPSGAAFSQGFTKVTNCSIGSGATTYPITPSSGAQDVWFDCPGGLVVQNGGVLNLLADADATYVFTGNITVENGGLLNVINATSLPGTGLSPSTCTQPAPGIPPVPDMTIYVRNTSAGSGSNLTVHGTANLCNTFIYAEGDSARTSGGLLTFGSSNSVFWWGALGTTPESALFGKLMFWTEGSGVASHPSTNANCNGCSTWDGGAHLAMAGILFAPNTEWAVAGGGSGGVSGSTVNATRVQMWWDSLKLKGNSVTLLLQADPSKSQATAGGVSLIR